MQQFSLEKSSLCDSAPEFDFSGIANESNSRARSLQEIFRATLSPQNRRLLSPGFYSIDGGLITSEEVFDRFAPEFFHRSRRVVRIAGQVHLRGTRYTISTNPTFELRQKLAHFKEDLDEALQAIQETKHAFFQLGIADYAKNSIITMLNSFLHEEKQGKYRFDQVGYQSVRRDGQSYAQAAVDFFYGVLLQAQNMSNSGYRTLVEKRKTFDKLQEHILLEYQRGVFSSRHITRREAAHPLTIAAAAAQYARYGSRKCETIIGLPSGSTELALAHATAQRFLNRKKCEVLLVPVSLHSSKDEFDAHDLTGSDLVRWTSHHEKKLAGKHVAIVDDNSSTGQTIQFVSDALQPAKIGNLEVAVAEADVTRSKLDLHHPLRKNIATRSLYQHSVGVLAVSKRLRPKADLRGIYEQRKMLHCVRKRYLTEECNLSRQIVGRTYCDLLKTKTEDVLSKLPDDKIIRVFRKTFLSNFFPVSVAVDGVKYDSVEHAYQAMKFEAGTWEKISDSDIEAINRKLAARGARVTRADLPKLFVKPEISAGTSKVAANYLRILGFVRSDWDDVKVSIMTDLLLQKFSQSDLYSRLQKTNGIYLIEGNDWEDTFWGECNGRGRNVLGRMLMVIREIQRSELSSAAEVIRNKNHKAAAGVAAN
ncbi:NADAR domain-containing protein [Salipiger abyssi]|uniref:NADAR domain-containing protein n=1 Tax=Salipiger abyssi TaxID=1250539 RepID=UPI004058D919